ncbi:MAG: hypothetical protein ACK5DC_02220, partial [Burkholderiales bacterium]
LPPLCIFPGLGRAFVEVYMALETAPKRLAAMHHAPAKHARHALKVLLKFLMLDLEWADRAALEKHLAGATLLGACAKQMGMAANDALHGAIDELIAQGALRCEGTRLFNDDHRRT